MDPCPAGVRMGCRAAPLDVISPLSYARSSARSSMSASAMNASGLGPSPWGAPRSAVNPVMSEEVLVR